MWNFRPEEVALPLPRLAGPLEADRVVRDLKEVNGLTVVFRQVPRQLVVCGVRQIHIFCNSNTKIMYIYVISVIYVMRTVICHIFRQFVRRWPMERSVRECSLNDLCQTWAGQVAKEKEYHCPPSVILPVNMQKKSALKGY